MSRLRSVLGICERAQESLFSKAYRKGVVKLG